MIIKLNAHPENSDPIVHRNSLIDSTYRQIFSLPKCRKLFSLLILLFGIHTYSNAQILDLARIEFTSIPTGNSNVRYQRQRALFNIPFKLKAENYFFVGLDYSSIDLEFNQAIPEFDKTELEQFQILDLNLSYLHDINDDWRFGTSVSFGFTSNLTRKELISDDFSFSGRVAFIKDKKNDKSLLKPYRLILGLSYSENGGIPFPIPFVSYYKRFHAKWSYNLGVPTSNLQYHFSKTLRFKFIAQLDGFNSNIQRSVLVNGSENANQISMSLITGGLRTEYNLSENIEMFLNTNYIFSNNIQLRSNRNKIINLNNGNRHYFSFGVRIKP